MKPATKAAPTKADPEDAIDADMPKGMKEGSKAEESADRKEKGKELPEFMVRKRLPKKNRASVI